MAAGTKVTADGRARVLADGNEIPLLGLGVWQVPDGPECENAVRWALELGYRHVDTAQAYGNEASVGRALRDSGVPREDVFITTKFHPGRKDPEAEAQRSLERLGVDHVDLYIIHWPAGRADVGVGRHAARAGGRATRARSACRTSAWPRSTSCWRVADVAARRQPGPVQPVRVPPRAARGQRGARHRARGLQPARHRPPPRRPAGRARSPTRVGRTPAQVLIRWCVQRDLVVLPKSTHRERIEENAQRLRLHALRRGHGRARRARRTGGTDRARESQWW